MKPFDVFNAARDARDLSSRAKLALFVLASRLPEIRPSLLGLAEDMASDKKTVRRAIAELVGKGWISTVPGRQHVATRYTILPSRGGAMHPLGAIQRGSRAPAETESTGVQRGNPVPPEGESCPSRGGAMHPEHVKEHEKEHVKGERASARATSGAKTKPKATRMAPDWAPSPEAVTWCTERNVDALACLDEFRDYWSAVPGGKGLKSDWDATFRNSVRRLLEQNRAPMAPRRHALAVVKAAPPDPEPTPLERVAQAREFAEARAKFEAQMEAKGVPR